MEGAWPVILGAVLGFLAATGRDIIGWSREARKAREEDARKVRRAASLVSEELASAFVLLSDVKRKGEWYDPHRGRILPSQTWTNEKGVLAEAGKRKAFEAASNAYVAMDEWNWKLSERKSSEEGLQLRFGDGLDQLIDAISSARAQLGRLIGSG